MINHKKKKKLNKTIQTKKINKKQCNPQGSPTTINSFYSVESMNVENK